MASREKKTIQRYKNSVKQTVQNANSSNGKKAIWLFDELDKDGDFAFDILREDFQHKEFLQLRCDSLRKRIINALNDDFTPIHGRYAPDWIIDYMNSGRFMNWSFEHFHNGNAYDWPEPNKRFYLQSGDMDGVALQIGYQAWILMFMF